MSRLPISGFFLLLMYLLSRVFSFKHTFSNQISVSSTAFLFRKTMSTTTTAASNEKSGILNWASKDGEFRRQQSTFRDTIEADSNAKFAAEP